MINNVTHLPKMILQQLRYNIVIRYQKRRSVFDKTSLNPQWIPRTQPYSKHRKPRQQQWSDPNNIYPLLIPPMHKPMKPKTYLKQIIQHEEMQKSWRKKQFLIQDIRSGDIIQVTYQQTFENQKLVVHKCFVLGFRRKNSLSAMLQVAIRFGGMSVKAIIPVHSPKVRNIKLISKGSGNFRSNLKTKWMSMTKKKLLNPRIKKGVIKLRGNSHKRKKSRYVSAFKYNKIQSDIVKTIK